MSPHKALPQCPRIQARAATGRTFFPRANRAPALAAILKANPNTAFALLIEPDSLPNLVTNIDLTTCQDSADGYRDGVAYALETLNLPNVVQYLGKSGVADLCANLGNR